MTQASRAQGWQFYGRSPELAELTTILSRKRWFFVKVSGRRRIGKTTLVQHRSQRPLLHPRQLPSLLALCPADPERRHPLPSRG